MPIPESVSVWQQSSEVCHWFRMFGALFLPHGQGSDPNTFQVRTHAWMLAVEYVLRSLDTATISQKVMAEDTGIERLAYLLIYYIRSANIYI